MEFQETIDRATTLSGDKSRLRDLLHSRLAECGWHDEVKLMCREVIQERSPDVRTMDLVDEVTPQARALVPDGIKKELLMKIKAILAAESGVDL